MIHRSILTFMLFAGFVGITFAQPNDRREVMKEKIKSIKIAFLTSELELTPEESKTFWPLYEAHENQIEALRKDIRTGNSDQDLNDEEARQLLNKHFDMEKEKLKLEEAFVAEMIPIIGPQRVIRMKKSDEKFNRKLLERTRENRSGNARQRGRSGGRF